MKINDVAMCGNDNKNQLAIIEMRFKKHVLIHNVRAWFGGTQPSVSKGKLLQSILLRVLHQEYIF
jgi:hypothetical protein